MVDFESISMCSISSTNSGTALSSPMIFCWGLERSTAIMRICFDCFCKYLQTGLMG